MPGPLTADEKASCLDNLGWSNGQYQEDYARIYVVPVLDQLTDESKLKIVRGHLLECNNVLTQLTKSLSKIELLEVKGIKFNAAGQTQLIQLHAFWAQKLALSLNVKRNPEANVSKRSRPIT